SDGIRVVHVTGVQACALLSAGDDTFIWDPGDGSDIVEGQAGVDTMRFNGANIAEQFDASANGNRLRFTRNVGNIVMDTNDVERRSEERRVGKERRSGWARTET